jgi:signal transduction histidine kinase
MPGIARPVSDSHPLATRNRWYTMTTRTRQLIQRSRDLLERSRVAAVQFLDSPRPATALPRVIEGSRDPMVHQEPEGAVVDICASIALRDLNLVDSLLSLLERLEESEADPDRLTELYRLDHLATRLRRNAENLRVLAGHDASDGVSDSASLVDVIRAAMSSIDGYSRVSIGRVLSLGVVGIAADDLSRLLAELLDNAAKQSPPDTTVRVSAYLTDSGSVLLRIEDDGIGVPEDRVAELNERLSDEPRLTDDSVRHMGLAVVRRLAARHDMRVRLNRRAPHGTTATVLLPPGLLCELPGEAWTGSQTVVRPASPPRSPTPPASPTSPASHASPASPTSSASHASPTPPASPAVPAPARGPSPRHAREPVGTTAAGLPQRAPNPGRVATRGPQPADLTEPGRTVNGLPRRVSRSIRNAGEEDAVRMPAEEQSTPTPRDEGAGHKRLLADLDAFTAGERAAKEEVEQAAGPATAPVAEPAVESAEPAAEPAESVAESGIETPVEPAVEIAVEPVPEAVAGPAAESVAEPATGPAGRAAESVAERGVEAPAEPAIEMAVEPVAGSVAESGVEAPAGPATGRAAESVVETGVEAPAGPAIELAVEPVAEAVARPAAEMAVEPVGEVVAGPAAGSVVETGVEAPAEPAIELAVEPVAESVAEAAGETRAELEAELEAELVVEPEPEAEPVAEPVAEFEAEPESEAETGAETEAGFDPQTPAEAAAERAAGEYVGEAPQPTVRWPEDRSGGAPQ